MFTKLMKWFSITLLVSGLSWGSSADFRISMEIVVCVAAMVVVTQAFRIGKHFWRAPGLSPSRCYLIPSRP